MFFPTFETLFDEIVAEPWDNAVTYEMDDSDAAIHAGAITFLEDDLQGVLGRLKDEWTEFEDVVDVAAELRRLSNDHEPDWAHISLCIQSRNLNVLKSGYELEIRRFASSHATPDEFEDDAAFLDAMTVGYAEELVRNAWHLAGSHLLKLADELEKYHV